MPYRDLFEKLEKKPDIYESIHCPKCGRELNVRSTVYLHTMIKRRYECESCKVNISIKTEKEND